MSLSDDREYLARLSKQIQLADRVGPADVVVMLEILQRTLAVLEKTEVAQTPEQIARAIERRAETILELAAMEITPAMVETGALTLAEYNSWVESTEAGEVRIFRAMLAARATTA